MICIGIRKNFFNHSSLAGPQMWGLARWSHHQRMYQRFLFGAGILNVLIGLLYLPGTPWYVLDTLEETEILVWAGAVILLSSLLIFSALTISSKRKWKIATLLSMLAFLHLGALFAYWIFLPEAMDGTIGESPFNQATLSWTWLFLHGIMMFVLIVLILFLFFDRATSRDTRIHS